MNKKNTIVGCVAIGRNEGERLRTCLASVQSKVANVVYVDSDSTDGSVEMARAMGVEVVQLDLSTPFTAGRARNTGFSRLLELNPNLVFVQFVDGDCEIVEGWLETAKKRLESRQELAVVCGRRRERRPESSIYNRICDVEWDTPVGDALACGGDAMMRIDAFREVGGFNPSLIAGEEPELCLRMRRLGYMIERLDVEMTLHDAEIKRFSQWWKRNIRAGYAFAEGATMHGNGPERHWVRESRKTFFWGGIIPTITVLSSVTVPSVSMLMLTGYFTSTVLNYKRTRRRGRTPVDSFLWATSCTLSKFPELQGSLRYHLMKRRGQRSGIIEYKTKKR